MKYFLSFLALAFSYTSFGQLTITQQASCTSYTLTANMVGLTPTSSGITADDGYGPVENIGFTFNFFGTNYTQCIIGSNGVLGFDIANAGAYNTWPIGATLASTAATAGGDIHNLIAAPWCDIYIPAGGTLMYSLVGTAPNRKFEVTWCGEAMYSCNAQFITTQAIIYETTNIVEVHIGHKEICTGWNGGYAETGVVNQNGSSCTMAPGPPALEDYPNQWSITTAPANNPSQAWRFTPNAGGTAYTVASIPYAPIPYASSAIYWYDSTTHAYLGSGTTLVVTPAVGTTYEACALGCGDTTKAFLHVGAVGSGGGGGAIIPANFNFTTHLGCNGDTVVLNNLTVPDNFHNYWTFGDGSPVDSADINPVHVYNDAPGYVGSYTITLVYNSTYNPGCATTFSLPVSFNHPIDAHITSSDTIVCLYVPQSFTGTTISTNGPTYGWDFGNLSGTATTNPAEYTYPQPGNYNVTFTVTDSIGCVRVDSQHTHVVQVVAHTAVHDTSICLLDSLTMNAYATVYPANATTYSLLWSPTNNIGDATSASTNFFGYGDFIYTVTATTLFPTCTATDTEAVHSYPPITLTNLTASQTIPWGSTIQLNADGALYYTWVPNDGSLSNPNINDPIAAPIDSVTKYVVYGMSQYGCLDSANVTISMGTMTQFMPSAFTPNGDGLNDVFRITNMTFQKLVDFRVFNRWGQQVFQTANREVGWDGTWKGVPQDMGVYNYVVIIGLVDGTNKTYKGTVTLIR